MSRFMKVFLKITVPLGAWIMALAVVHINWGEECGGIFFFVSLMLASCVLVAKIIVKAEE